MEIVKYDISEFIIEQDLDSSRMKLACLIIIIISRFLLAWWFRHGFSLFSIVSGSFCCIIGRWQIILDYCILIEEAEELLYKVEIDR